MNLKRLFFICCVLLFSNTIFGFTINVVPTDETCSGNGALSFNPSNTDPNGTIVYFIYKLPNTSIPLATTSNSSIGSLTAGNYRVIAKETVNGVETSQTQDVTITNSLEPLTYTINSLNQACSTTSNVTVTVTSGTAVSYQIISGPMQFPAQASNSFIGLPVGSYTFLVTDSCGGGLSQTFTATLNPTGLTIAPPTFTNTMPPSCAFTVVNNTINAANGTVIGYPLSVQYTVHPPTGPAIVYNNTIVNGNAQSQNLSQTIPYYINQTYSYDIAITDACGTTVTKNFPVNLNITLGPTIINLNCNNHYFELNASNFTPPYTLTFTTFPAGFNPASYPSTYSQATSTFGSMTSSVPTGSYAVTIVDSCGRTTVMPTQFSIVNIPIIPTGIGTNDGCLTTTGTIVITINDSDLQTVIITSGPASYPFPYPHPISSLIDADGNLTLSNVPIGTYTFSLTDICNTPLSPLDVTIPIYTNKGSIAVVKNGCELQKGSIKIKSANGNLTAVIMSAAPPGIATPVDVSSNIINFDGACYLNNLPAGNYVFNTTDICGFMSSVSINVAGYSITTSEFSLVPNCGSFDLNLNFVSNGTSNQKFWLQRLINGATDTWGNPADNTKIYPSGTVPTAVNSIALTNNATNFNLPYNGTFRIVRAFSSYNNGNDLNTNVVSSINSNCIEILSPTLGYNQVLEIVDAYRLPCSTNGNLDVVIVANGPNPIHYSIINPDGTLFFDNGNSNTFYNLPPGNYIFKVEVACGDFKTQAFSVTDLLSLVNINKPLDLVNCQLIITGNETYDLTLQNGTILGSQATADYSVSYYTSQANAQSGSNQIANPTTFNPTTNPQTIYARLIFNALPGCYETTSFEIYAGQTPQISINSDYLNCTSNPTVVDASIGNLPSTTYLWSDGDTNPIKTFAQGGTTTLTVTATNSYGVGMLPCSSPPKTITVIISEIPKIDHIETTDWTAFENSITVFTTNNVAFEYSLDDIHYQNSNYFSNLNSGLYTVYVRDIAGCGTTSQVVWLLNYPRYFTPNGDGYNETWRIENQELETDFTVSIYDRYGKLMNYFASNSLGWDGTYNGNLMLATDYWFVVNRQDGRTLRGHFALKR